MSWREGLPHFHPRRWMRNGHVQTIAGNYLRRDCVLPAPERVLVEVTPPRRSQIASQVLCECHWQPADVRAQRTTVIILHGLEGSSRSQYVLGNTDKLLHAGCNVIRMNMRNCGGRNYEMARLTPTLYHSGMSSDVAAVMDHFLQREGLERIALLGYSMGGNLMLKLAGDLGSSAPAQLRCVVGVSPVMDLAQSADALHEPGNRVYEWKFLRALNQRFRHKASLFPRAFDERRTRLVHSLRDFDQQITALYSGFASADDYYERAASARVLANIAIPTLVLHAEDDPFIRITPATRAALEANRCITFLETAHGGHCAFLAEPGPNDDGRWAELLALRFILAHAAPPDALP